MSNNRHYAGMTNDALERYLDWYIRRVWGRTIDPYFLGTVVSYSQVTTGAGASQLTTGYLVSIQRVGEATPDGNQYAVLGDYVPVVGDTVECMWRDAATGYVLSSLVPQRSKYSTRARNTSSTSMTPANTPTKIILGSPDYDPAGCWNRTLSRYTAQVPGKYLIVWKLVAYSIADAVTCVALLYKNGTEIDRADMSSGTIDSPSPIVSGIYPLNLGDYIEPYGQTSAGSAASWGSSSQFSAISIQFLNGL